MSSSPPVGFVPLLVGAKRLTTLSAGLGVPDAAPDAGDHSGSVPWSLRLCHETAGDSRYSASPSSYLLPDCQEETLKGAGITHIVCVRQEKEAKFIRENMPHSFTYLTLDIADTPCQNIMRFFPAVSLFCFSAKTYTVP